ncbi:MAG: PilZ domain-containing protein [Endomicrobiia bacterium]|nr:PilZ domain-containing protein [Endomicrobiia bacterium]
MAKWLKDIYLGLRYGFSKRPERFKIHGLVAIAPARFRNEEERYVRAAVVDISASGAAVECFSEYKVEDEVVLEFRLPAHRVAVAGKIMRRHSQPPTWVYGVRFDDYSTDKNSIRQVLSFAKEEMRKIKNASKNQADEK